MTVMDAQSECGECQLAAECGAGTRTCWGTLSKGLLLRWLSCPTRDAGAGSEPNHAAASAPGKAGDPRLVSGLPRGVVTRNRVQAREGLPLASQAPRPGPPGSPGEGPCAL